MTIERKREGKKASPQPVLGSWEATFCWFSTVGEQVHLPHQSVQSKVRMLQPFASLMSFLFLTPPLFLSVKFAAAGFSAFVTLALSIVCMYVCVCVCVWVSFYSSQSSGRSPFASFLLFYIHCVNGCKPLPNSVSAATFYSRLLVTVHPIFLPAYAFTVCGLHTSVLTLTIRWPNVKYKEHLTYTIVYVPCHWRHLFCLFLPLSSPASLS